MVSAYLHGLQPMLFDLTIGHLHIMLVHPTGELPIFQQSFEVLGPNISPLAWLKFGGLSIF